jgi:hypothetical protein
LLHGWRRQARTVVAPASGGAGGRFVPVRIAPEEGLAAARPNGGPNAAIEVMLVNGVMLRVPEGVAVSRAAQLAAALTGLGR